MEEYYSKLVTKNELKIILEQMIHSICWIIKKEKNYEIGFFINIKYKDKKIPVLMTKYKLIDRYNDKNLNVIINNMTKIIKLGDAIYQNREYDLTLVEIKLNEKNNIKFIEIDDNIFNNDLENDYYKKPIYILQENKKDISVSFGKIEGIIKNDIKYSCYINSNSKSLPIFDLENNKIIGIYQSKSKYNKGILIKNIIKDFTKIFKNGMERKKNEINLLINIDKCEINKEIYFMDYYDNYHNNLKELNDSNTELYINNIKYKYNKYFIPKNEGKYNIKLKFNINIKDCSYMFANCVNIEKINLIDFNTENIINMQYMFYECNIKNINLFSFKTKKVKNMCNLFGNCKNIKHLDLSFLDINNVTDISGLFKGCSSLKSLPDISKWNTENINNMNSLFEECTSLKELPDISIWNIKKVNNINSIFKGCSFLISLPDISNWNINDINNMSSLFEGCSSLKTLPDISKWNMKKINNISKIFQGCSSLISLPDISLWNTENIINMSSLFDGCISLKSLPDISNWNTENINNISSLFKVCSSLESLPDISKWNMKNVENINEIFKGCSSIKSLPDISKWNTENINNMNSLFEGCSSLISLPDISKWNLNNLYYYRSIFKGCETINKDVFYLKEIKLEKDIKIFLCGKSGVGCNTLSYISDGGYFRYDTKTVQSFSYRQIILFNKIKVSLWNGPGQEIFLSMLSIFLKETDIVIFVYDITMRSSLDYLNILIKMAKDKLGDKFIGAIVGNKSDLFLKQEVKDEEAEKLAREQGYKFCLVSAKNNPQEFRNCLEELVFDYILALKKKKNNSKK